MTIVHLIVLFLAGFALVNLISVRFSWIEKLGFSYPLGFGLVTLIMMPYDLLGIPINISTLYIPQIIAIIVGLGLVLRKKPISDLFSIDQLKRIQEFRFSSINLPWIFIALVMGYVLYAVIAKAMFWPTISFDSVAGYDFVGKLIAIEGKVNSSMFDPNMPFYSIRSGYPLYVPGSFGYAYIMGFESSKITTVLLILSTVVLYYGLLKNYVNDTIAMLFTALFITTPEYIAMSALSLSNVPHTMLTVAAVVTLFIWMDKNEWRYFLIGVVFMALNVWARSDGINFIAGTGVAVLLYCYKHKAWKPLVIYGFVSILPFITWQMYLKNVLGIVNTNVFIDHLFWDSEKMDQMAKYIWNVVSNTQFFGVIVYLVPVGILINFKTIFKQHYYLLLAVFASLVVYTLLYYQMNTQSDDFGYSIKSMIGSSYKRGMFSFVGLFLFYIAISPIIGKAGKFIMQTSVKKS